MRHIHTYTPEVAAGVVLRGVAGEEEGSGAGDVEGGDDERLQGVQQGEYAAVFLHGVLLEQTLEAARGVLGPVQLPHGAVEGVVPARSEDVGPVL